MSLRSIALAVTTCAAATLSTLVPTPAAAADILVAPAADTITVRVSYADLNLANPQGRATLDRRIVGAARSICGSYFATDLRMAAMVENCRADAIASARLPAAYASNAGARDLTVTGNRMSRAAN